jgi:hypothetical protein
MNPDALHEQLARECRSCCQPQIIALKDIQHGGPNDRQARRDDSHKEHEEVTPDKEREMERRSRIF